MLRLSLAPLFFCIAFTTSLHAQDTLRKYNGKAYNLKVEEVKPFEITYRRKPNGDVRSISKSEVASITYADGKRDSFLVIDTRKQLIDTTASHLTKAALYAWGKSDAKRYYTGSAGANAGTYLTAFLVGPIIGLIPAVACSATKPEFSNMHMPNVALINSMDYREGYMRKAQSIKSTRVWLNWGAGTIAAAGAVLAYSLLHH